MAGTTGQDPNSLINGMFNDAHHSKTNILNTNASYGSLNDNLTNETLQMTKAPNSVKKSLRHGRLLGIMIALLACSTILAGIVNIIYSTLALASNSWGCLNSPANIFSQTLGPNSAPMVILNWMWISVGMWTAIAPLVAGLALYRSKRSRKKGVAAEFNPNLPTELQSSQNNDTNAVFTRKEDFNLISLETLSNVSTKTLNQNSYYCTSSGNAAKFILPIIVLSLAVLQFVLILLSWYKSKNASEAQYQYIGSTFTVYEVFEAQNNQPLLIKKLPPRPIVKVPYFVKKPVRMLFTPHRHGNNLRKNLAIKQRYYPRLVYGSTFGNMSNTYTHMYLPPATTFQ
ncbi:hypothetical protein HELRODRAFT_179205 [Helobdella robusta]|uniref:Uncharacterized protein n=1 Tax=Helobdella robusta TaxID=6412 RepID=T1FEC9_HELRO|nr:hypothetical protein HELRODRAFT_179205 [Helobdella robusta]ESN95734.1 hypothetical protein HELRODRAFT_179205 [Helobdella robusta]